MAIKMKEKKEKFSPLTIILLVVLVLYCISFFYLLIWGICASMKVNNDFLRWEPSRLFSSYEKYDDYLKMLIVNTTKDVDTYKLLGVKASLGLANAPEQQVPEFQARLGQYQSIQSEMGAWIPFYTYKYAFRVFSYAVTNDNVVRLGRLYLNSILYAGGCGFAATFVPCIAAYACARFPYKFSRIMHTTVIIVMMIPIVGSQPSEIEMAVNLHIFDTVYCLWIMRANFLGLYFLMFYDICKALPTSFSEAAKMDGANNFQIFFKIAMPLIKNTFMTVFLIRFIAFWNEYQAPMLYTPSYPTVAMGLNQLMSVAGGGPSTKLGIFDMTFTPSRMAAAVLTAAPVCILFAIFQKRLLGNLTMGGIKG
ncbi:MAG: carbohydrate ABC transporter permease [Clostridiales bacterium]|nr:carbohydrate ABC transporter permease [Clostridiales bacterium]